MSPQNSENDKQYREQLANQLKQEPDKEKRRGKLESAQQTSEYKEARETHLAETRAKESVDRAQSKESKLNQEKERQDYIQEIEQLKLQFETKIEETNQLINQFFEGFLGDLDSVPTPDSAESVYEQLRDLKHRRNKDLQSNPLDGQSYLAQAAQALLQLKKLERETRWEIETHQQKEEKLTTRFGTIQAWTNSRERQNFLKRLVSHFEIKKLREELRQTNAQLTSEKEIIQKQSEKLKTMADNRHSIEQSVATELKSEINETATHKIGQALNELWGKISQNPFLQEETGKAYIEQILRPAFNKMLAEQRPGQEYYSYRSHNGFTITEETRNTLFADIEKYLRTPDETSGHLLWGRAAELPQTLSILFQPLLQSSTFDPAAIEKITSLIFAQYATEKISAGEKNLESQTYKLTKQYQEKEKYIPWSDRADQIINRVNMPFPSVFEELPHYVKGKLVNQKLDRELPDMTLWAIMKNLTLPRELFGETLTELDQKYFHQILEGSLTDKEGPFIDKLAFYPHPEAIKTLVLLAAADFKEYRTIHANQTLEKLAERPDWPAILNQAETKYPELKLTRSILENSTGHDPHIRNSELVKQATELAVTLIEKEPKNQSQAKLAAECLPNQQLLSILRAGEKLPGDQIDLFQQADAITENLRAAFRFHRSLRNLFLETFQLTPTEVAKKNAGAKALLAISKKIIDAGDNTQMIEFLTRGEIQNAVENIYTKSKKTEPEEVKTLLSAYKELPCLSENNYLLLETFCKHFQGNETIEFYKKLAEKYSLQIENNPSLVTQLAQLVGENKLKAEPALALSAPIPARGGLLNFLELSPANQTLALTHPKDLLGTPDGLDLLRHISTGSNLENLPPELESAGSKFDAETLKMIANLELSTTAAPLFANGLDPELNEKNWKGLLLAFIGATQGNWYPEFLRDKDTAHRIKKVFENEGAKNLCLSEMKKLWQNYLQAGQVESLPLSLLVINKYIQQAQGAGPLSQIEALSSLANNYATMLNNPHTVPRTQQEIITGLASIENKFLKERWANEDITDFYNISGDLISAAPSLFSEYLQLFKKFKPKELKEFSKELFPLHRAILSLNEKRNKDGSTKFNPRDLVRLRQNIANTLNESGQIKSLEIQKKELTTQILKMFRNKFGIIKIPDTLNAENLKALSAISLYLANLSGRDAQKEDLLSFYQALNLNNRWEDYRCGAEINPAEYLTPEKANIIKSYLEKRAKLNPITPENLNLPPEKMPEFMKILQEESENVMIGNIETVDVKLNNVIANLRGLEDPDLYPDPMDKQRLQLLLRYGNKKLGSVTAKIYQSLAKPGKPFEPSEEEAEIKAEIESLLRESNIELTSKNLKKHLQDEIKPLATVANILSFVEEIGAEREISELQKILKPSEEVIALFNKMGAEFKPTSGAIALSQDLEYLDNLVTKNAEELSEPENRLAKEYLSNVRQKLATLEGIYELISKKFANLQQSQAETKNELLRSKLEDISKVINRAESQQVIISTLTNNLPYIISNIRECLTCVREGSNNDTNLTFGDMNKFYLSSKSEMKAASLADELVFFVPVTFADGQKEMAFVLDRLYGTHTPAILINQIETVYKKYTKIKNAFPEAKISILITNAAIQTGGISAELLLDRLQEKLGGKVRLEAVSTAEVDVVKSAACDHYVEFGGETRKAGARSVNGIIISTDISKPLPV